MLSDSAGLNRTIAFVLIGAASIAALYFGQEVLLPTAVAILIAFILGPATTWLHRLLPRPLAVATIVILALGIFALLAVLVMSQLADVAGSLTVYRKANIQQKIKDIRDLSEGGGPLSRFAR